MLKKFRILLVLASLIITLCIMSDTYSRYIANSDGNVQAEFARWQLLVNNTDITSSTVSELSFEPVVEKNNNVAENKVAPSSKGFFDIEIDPKNVDVSFKYTINLEMNDNVNDLMITKYAFVPENYSEGEALNYVYLDNVNISSITQEIKYGDTNNMTKEIIEDTEIKVLKPIKIRVFFEWVEGTVNYTNDTTKEVEKTVVETMNDEADTAIGIDAANDINSTFTVNANISFEQIIA